MITVRHNVFETNSSSTHSITICTQKQFDDWKAGKCFFNVENDTFVYPSEDSVNRYRQEAIDQYKCQRDSDPYSVKWDMLSTESQEKYIAAHVKYKLEQERSSYCSMSYDNYRHYHKEGCEYTERFYTTEHGDKIVAFGKGGYDG